MTQPAKVQEPSMEEILASIRRIIADDEAKPAEKPAGAATPAHSESPAAAPAAKPAVMTDIPPSALVAGQATPARAPDPPPAAGNSQDDIDAMLAGLDAATSEAEVRPPLPDGEVFELTDEMALPDPQPAPFRTVEPEDDLEFSEAAAASAAPRAQYRQPAFEPPPLYESPVAPPQQMLSRSTVSAVESAFNTLANTVLSNNARTLEDLVKEMLRPMLKSWLDDNLPGLVERIVKAEIERVSRGR
jgi:cell pole-organizing protein PopZ